MRVVMFFILVTYLILVNVLVVIHVIIWYKDTLTIIT